MSDNVMRSVGRVSVYAVIALAAVIAVPLAAKDVDSAITTCLSVWGKHPFGNNPKYRTLATSVKVFGIGRNTGDSEPTNAPSLVLVNPGVNVMGGTTLELLNPNGWYCLRTSVNVMGGLNIKAHCQAKLASTSDTTATVLGNNEDGKAITVMGSTTVERVGCGR